MITAQQHKTLLFIEAYIERKGGVSPSIRDIARHLKHASTASSTRLLRGLEERGMIKRPHGRARAIEVAKPVSRFATFKFNDKTKEIEPMTSQ